MQKHVDSYQDAVERATDISKDKKDRVRRNLEVVVRALADALQSVERDKADPCFLVHYTVACGLMGNVEEIIWHGQRQSATLSEYAKRAHAEDYALRDCAIDYWEKNIDPKLSNEAAAEILKRVVKVSHRKLVEYVSKAKKDKKSRSAGTA